MIFSKQYPRDKKSNSTKKVHRRFNTEMDEQPLIRFPRPDLKKSEKLPSKPKFIDVYSKYAIKDLHPHKEILSSKEPLYPLREPGTQRKNFKIYQNKLASNLPDSKYLKTEPD